MERNERNRYYQQDNRYGMDRDYDRNAYSNNYGRDNDDYGRDQQNRRWVQESREDFRERGVMNNDNSRFQDYRDRDYDMERNYRDNTRGQQDRLGDIRQGYGYSSFGNNSSDRNSNRMDDMQRERNSQMHQGFGSGRMSGYSGSRFGGSNYSSDGDFGGSSNYDSMSGAGGNMERTVSSSGYGGGNRSALGGDSFGDRNYGMRNRSQGNNWSSDSNRGSYGNYGDSSYGRRDRGGYYNEDRNR